VTIWGWRGKGDIDSVEFYVGMMELHKARMILKAEPLVCFLHAVLAFTFFAAGS
jgi:hypothetical protein